MTKKLKQKSVSSPLSRDPYKRREESEIIKILDEIGVGRRKVKKTGLRIKSIKI